MATVRPFRAVRPSAEKAAETAALPYDVMNRKEAAEMAKGKPCSFLHISRAEIDLPEIEDPYCSQVYHRAKCNIEDSLEKGWLIEEDAPALYIYRQEMDGRFQTGIVGCVSIDEYENNTIKKHELTRYEKEVDRINHFDACSANTEPVFLTYRDDAQIRGMMEGWMADHAPVYDFTGDDGVGHTLWVIDDESLIKALRAAFDSIPSLYIADGHHRSASAYEVGKRRRAANPDYTGEEEFNFFMAVIFPDADLKIFDYNRVVRDLNGLDDAQILEKIGEAGFDVQDMGETEYRPEKLHEFSLYLHGHWYKMTCRDSIIPDDVIGALDVSILQDRVLAPILGIGDPRLDSRIDFVGGIRGLGELKRRAEQDMELAFAVYPVTCDDLMSIADCGEIMPPKSTWFEPKLGSGLFMHKF